MYLTAKFPLSFNKLLQILKSNYRVRSTNWIFREQDLKGFYDEWITSKKNIIWEQPWKFISGFFSTGLLRVSYIGSLLLLTTAVVSIKISLVVVPSYSKDMCIVGLFLF